MFLYLLCLSSYLNLSVQVNYKPVFFFLIHSHLIHSHIDVYMLYFRDWSCIDYDRQWSIIPSVTQQVLGAYFLKSSVHMLDKQLISICPTPVFSANSKRDEFFSKSLNCLSWLKELLHIHFQNPPTSENSAVATGLEKVSFHSNSKERQC